MYAHCPRHVFWLPVDGKKWSAVEKCNLFIIVLRLCTHTHECNSTWIVIMALCFWTVATFRCDENFKWKIDQSMLNSKATKTTTKEQWKHKQTTRNSNKMKQLVLNASLEWCWSKHCTDQHRRNREKNQNQKNERKTWRNSRWRNNCCEFVCMRGKTKETV